MKDYLSEEHFVRSVHVLVLALDLLVLALLLVQAWLYDFVFAAIILHGKVYHLLYTHLKNY